MTEGIVINSRISKINKNYYPLTSGLSFVESSQLHFLLSYPDYFLQH